MIARCSRSPSAALPAPPANAAEDDRIEDVEDAGDECGAEHRVHDAFPGMRVGRLSSTPPQFGHLPASGDCAQAAQNVHSNEQMKASGVSAGRGRLQRSQLARISSTGLTSRRTEL